MINRNGRKDCIVYRKATDYEAELCSNWADHTTDLRS